jgi:hypothetical protein
MNEWLTARLATRTAARHDLAVRKADGSGRAVGRVVAAVWKRLLDGLRDGPASYPHNYRHAEACLEWLASGVYASLRDELALLSAWCHDRAADDLLATLPRAYLYAAISRKVGDGRPLDSRAVVPVMRPGGLVAVQESGASALGIFGGRFDWLDLSSPLRGEGEEALTAAQQRNLFAALLFPPPLRDQVDSILDQLLPRRDWLARAEPGGSSPQLLASRIASGIAQGKSKQQIAAELRPVFDGSAVRARRAARTYGIYVSNAMQLQAAEQIGDLVAGYKVVDPGGPTARKDHMKRSGTVYWRKPTGKQVGMDVMPNPPFDRGGPHEDRTGLRWNCRCFLLPVLAPLKRAAVGRA